MRCPGVQLSARCTFKKSRLASPLKAASADDCTTLPLSAALLSRAMQAGKIAGLPESLRKGGY